MKDISEIVAKVWPEWKIESTIGFGTYATVYKIVHTGAFHFESALKAIYIQQTNTNMDAALNELNNEITALCRLRTEPNIVNIEDVATYEDKDNKRFIILIRMELLNPCDRALTLDINNVVKLGIDICSAIESCSGAGIIHRDIKPSNIFINETGTFKLGDFGISRTLTFSEMTEKRGTKNYMPPEAINGTYDFTSDMYSLGIVMYQFLNNNRPPFVSLEKQILSVDDYDNSVYHRMAGTPLPHPCNSEDKLTEIILKACAYNKSERYS